MQYISLFSPLFPLIAFFSGIRKSKEKTVSLILLYVCYSFSTDILTTLLDQAGLLTSALSTVFLSLFTVVEFTCFGIFFYFIIKRVILRKFIIIGVFFIASFLIANIFFQFIEFENLDSIPVTLQGIFIMPLALIYYFEQIKNPDALFIYGTPNFWLVTGILLYLAGTFFIFILSENLTESEFEQYWPINYFFNTLKNLFLGLGIYMHNKRQNQKEKDNSLHYST